MGHVVIMVAPSWLRPVQEMTTKNAKKDTGNAIEYDDAEIFVAWDENGLYVASTNAEDAIETLAEETEGHLRSVARFEVKLPIPTIQDGGELIVPARGQALKVVS